MRLSVAPVQCVLLDRRDQRDTLADDNSIQRGPGTQMPIGQNVPCG